MPEFTAIDRDKFDSMCATIYGLADCNTPQGLAEVMAVALYVHDCLLLAAEKRGYKEVAKIGDDGLVELGYPAMPEGVEYPETILTRGG